MAPPRGKPPVGARGRKAVFPPKKPKKLAKKTYLCSVCSTTFFTLLELQDHLKAGHPTPSDPPAPAAAAIPAHRVPNVVPKPQAGRVVKPPRKQPGQTVGKNSAKWFCPVCVKPVKPVHSSSHMVERHLGYATFPKGWVFLCNQCDYRNRNHEARDRHVTLQHQRDPTKERAVFVALTQFQCRFCPHAAANYKALQEHCLNDHVPQLNKIKALVPVDPQEPPENEAVDADGEPEPKKQRACHLCKADLKATSRSHHQRSVHLGRLSLSGTIFLCPECPYRSRMLMVRDQHVREKHPAVDLNLPMVLCLKTDLKFHCSECTLSFHRKPQLKEHFDLVHKPGLTLNLEPKFATKPTPKRIVFESEDDEEEGEEEEQQKEAKEESSDDDDSEAEEEPKQLAEKNTVKSEEEEESDTSEDEPPLRPAIKTEVQTPLVPAVGSKRSRREEPVVFASFSTPAEPAVPLKRPKSEVQRPAVPPAPVQTARPPTPPVESKAFLRMNSRRVPHPPAVVNARANAPEVAGLPNGHLPPTRGMNAPMPNGAQSAERPEAAFFLMNTLLTHPPVIYYDYENLWPKYGALPIIVWKAAAHCQVLFLRLKTGEWHGEPQLDAPIVTSSMLRFEAPRNADRDSFVLGFTKEEAEEAAARLLIETNRHTTFSELIHDLVPSLPFDSALLITSDADRQTAEALDPTTSSVQYHVV